MTTHDDAPSGIRLGPADSVPLGPADSVRLVAAAVRRLAGEKRSLVAIDGVDGAGKTTFADRLARAVDRPVVRASCDDFHHPRAYRYRRGCESPEGFYLDSFDYAALTSLLLAPFAAGSRFQRRGFDQSRDSPVTAEAEDAPPDAVLVLDGLFLHRAPLRAWWDLSVLLDVSADIAATRLLERDGMPTRSRYVRGQQLYFADAEPRRYASIVIPW